MISSHLNYTESRFRRVSELYILLSCSPQTALKCQIIFRRIDVHTSERVFFVDDWLHQSKNLSTEKSVEVLVKPFTLQNL